MSRQRERARSVSSPFGVVVLVTLRSGQKTARGSSDNRVTIRDNKVTAHPQCSASVTRHRNNRKALPTPNRIGGTPDATMLPLTAIEESWIYSLTRHSTHPYSARIAESLAENYSALTVSKFCETSGYGIEGQVQGREIWIGSRAWLESRGVCVGQASSLSQEYSVQIHLKNGGRQDACPTLGNAAHVAIDGQYRGAVCGR